MCKTFLWAVVNAQSIKTRTRDHRLQTPELPMGRARKNAKLARARTTPVGDKARTGRLYEVRKRQIPARGDAPTAPTAAAPTTNHKIVKGHFLEQPTMCNGRTLSGANEMLQSAHSGDDRPRLGDTHQNTQRRPGTALATRIRNGDPSL